jgi:hypothetical protein
LPGWWIGLLELGWRRIALIHRGPVLSLFAQMVGWLPQAGTGSQQTCTPSPRAGFRRAFADGNGARICGQEVSAPCPTLLVAGEREATAGRASNAALAALLPKAVAGFAPAGGHGWLAAEPKLHCRMVKAWIAGQEVPAELPTETTAWSREAGPSAGPAGVRAGCDLATGMNLEGLNVGDR